ncbi:MAG: DUF1361 domain-containing protein [Spirosoma sp.]|nr:DUF1361 domain-containing protein [Spirosoma sp.]
MQHPLLSLFSPDVLSPGNRQPGRGLRALALLAIAGLSLVVVRGLLTGNWWFFMMLTWNLVLAFFPLGVVLVLRDLRSAPDGKPWFQSRALLGSGLLLWLAFLPNAPYIITDLFHIQHVQANLLWFDTMTFFVFAQTGVVAGLYSVLIVHRLLRPLAGHWLSWGLVLGSQWLAGFGVYLGRFGRWNSWDVLAQPLALFNGLTKAALDPTGLKITLAYGFVLAVLYVAFYWYVEQDRRA